MTDSSSLVSSHQHYPASAEQADIPSEYHFLAALGVVCLDRQVCGTPVIVRSLPRGEKLWHLWTEMRVPWSTIPVLN